MSNIVEFAKTLPTYVIELVQKYSVAAIIAAVVFLFILFFTNKVANFIRKIFILAVFAICAYAYFKSNWNLLATAACALLVLLVFRLIGYIINTIRTNRRNKRIEERALQKSASRRGSFKNKQGYSGARRTIEKNDETPEKMNREEIEAIIRNELSEKPEEVTEDLTTDDGE